MIILGIDPGTALTGFGAVVYDGHNLTAGAYGCIRTDRGEPAPLRLRKIHAEVSAILDDTNPDVVAMERLFFNANAKTAISVGQAQGVVMLAAASRGVPVVEHTPLEVKMAIVGNGRASKQQVQRMVQALLGLCEPPKPDDTADALAIAICHAHSSTLTRLITNDRNA